MRRSLKGWAQMDIVLIVLGVALSVLTFVFRPTAMVARGGNWLIFGALLIIATMMLLFFSVKDMGQPSPDGDNTEPGLTQDNVDAIEKALGK